MEQTGSNDNVTAPPADADDLVARSLETLLALGLPDDSKFTARIRPLALDLLMQIDPQDAAERMLAVQMIASFSRSLFLSRNANFQKNPKWFALFSGECNRSMAMFRRQMQTFTDLRRPRRTTFNAIRQANIAGQQIVVNQPPQSSAPTGASISVTTIRDEETIQETQAALPSQRSGPRRPERNCSEEPPLGT